MNRDMILGRATAPKTTIVTLDDGEAVRVRKLTQAEVEVLRKNYATENRALEGFRYIVSRCVVDDAGDRVFTDADAAKLLDVDFETIQAIAAEVVEFSGLNRSKK